MSFKCSLDNENYKNCGEGRSGEWTGKNIPDGQHVFTIKGVDKDGNVLVVAKRTWKVSRGKL